MPDLIASRDLKKSAAEIVIDDIPGRFRCLILDLHMRTDRPSIKDELILTINNDKPGTEYGLQPILIAGAMSPKGEYTDLQIVFPKHPNDDISEEYDDSLIINALPNQSGNGVNSIGKITLEPKSGGNFIIVTIVKLSGISFRLQTVRQNKPKRIINNTARSLMPRR